MSKTSAIVLPMPTPYAAGKTHTNYACSKCGTTGGKLWREYNTFLDYQTLYCLPCAHREESVRDGKQLPCNAEKCHYHGEAKRREYAEHTRGWCPAHGIDILRGCQVGSLIPAIPTEEGDTFWGFTSVPQPGCIWWDGLPLYGEFPWRAPI